MKIHAHTHTYKLLSSYLEAKRCKTIFYEEKPILNVYVSYERYI
jgi:hypothetical protein